MRGKIVKVAYFKEQGLEVFLKKLRSQGWLKLFTNSQLGCSQPELAEFYARVSVTKGTVKSEVNGVQIVFDAQKSVIRAQRPPTSKEKGYGITPSAPVLVHYQEHHSSGPGEKSSERHH